MPMATWNNEEGQEGQEENRGKWRKWVETRSVWITSVNDEENDRNMTYLCGHMFRTWLEGSFWT